MTGYFAASSVLFENCTRSTLRFSRPRSITTAELSPVFSRTELPALERTGVCPGPSPSPCKPYTASTIKHTMTGIAPSACQKAMYVTSSRSELSAIKLPEMDSIAEFSANNVAQVTESDGQILIDNVDHISEHNS